MPFFVPFSKRNKTKPITDVFSYADLPKEFRAQVTHILKKSIGNGHASHSQRDDRSNPSLWQQIATAVAEAHGLIQLPISDSFNADPEVDTLNYLMQVQAEKALDVIEICFLCIEQIISHWNYGQKDYGQITMTAETAIERLNGRFQEHSLGYSYTNGQIIRVDSEFVHQETVIPALTLLHTPGFDGPKVEFLRAHEKYKTGDYRGAIVDAENAFESTMKAICKARGWIYPERATAHNLLNTIFNNGLIPSHLDDNKQELRHMLAGVAVVRNKSTAAHGAGAVPVDVPSYLASYCLHLSGVNILFLVNLHKSTP